MADGGSFCGILNLAKSPGITSRAAVNRVQRLVRPTKVGHAGTLDPLATGVLLVPLGPATRLVNFLHRLRKRYLATFELGATSPTEDSDGPVTRLASPPIPLRDDLERAAGELVGPILQRPPAFSAIHVAGQRSYDLARRGAAVELAPRPIVVHSLAVRDYCYPHMTLDIVCGTGTYVRSLGRDLAESLGTSAVMTALARTEIGDFRLADALSLDDLTLDAIAARLAPPTSAVPMLPHVEVSAEQALRLRQGQRLVWPEAPGDSAKPFTNKSLEYAAIDPAGALVGVAEWSGGVLRPRVILDAAH